MILRPAKLDDIKIIFDWANDKEMRQNSFDLKSIAWENHVIWYNNKLNQNDSIILIGETEHFEKIGQ
ncbi:MAG: hypothetical protein O3A55_07760, partial [Bacteroidetes bacterium]|nr:hypothetical protein [Bacteroidota bacterium]